MAKLRFYVRFFSIHCVIELMTYRSSESLDQDVPRKRRKMEPSALALSQSTWTQFERDVGDFEVQYVQGKEKFAFGFVEGPLVKALRSGDW
jgi:midasin